MEKRKILSNFLFPIFNSFVPEIFGSAASSISRRRQGGAFPLRPVALSHQLMQDEVNQFAH